MAPHFIKSFKFLWKTRTKNIKAQVFLYFASGQKKKFFPFSWLKEGQSSLNINFRIESDIQKIAYVLSLTL